MWAERKKGIMNKLFTKIATLSVGLAMAVGVGVAVGTKAPKSVSAAKGDVVTDAAFVLSQGTSSTDSDGNNRISWSMASGKIVLEQMRCSASTNATDEAVFSAVNSNYIEAPRAYRGHTFALTATDDFMITSVKFVYTGSYYGLGLICGDTLDTSASMVTTKNKTTVTGAVAVVSDTTNYTASNDTNNKVWTVTCNISGGTSVMYAQNYDNNDSTSSTQLRPTSIYVSYIVGTEAKQADTVTITGESALNVGASSSYTAVCTNSGSSTDVDQTVTWSVSDPSVLAIDANGGVTALNDGTANVIATSSNNIQGVLAVTVSNGSTSIAPKTFSTSTLSMSGAEYASNNGYHVYRNFVIETYQVAVNGSDYTPSGGSTVYEKHAFIMQKTNGYMRTKTLMSAKITAVSISGVSDTAPAITVYGGDTLDSIDVESTLSSSGHIFTYSFSSAVNYITIKAGSSASYFNSFTLEYVGGVETVDSLSDYILGLIPDRSDDTSSCKGETGNYVIAKNRYAACSDEVRAEFQTSEDTTVVSARARFEAWAVAYGDSTPFEQTITASSMFSSSLYASDDNNTMLIIVAIAATSAIAFSALLILKKKKHNR